MNVDLGAGLDLTALVQTCLKPALIFIPVLGIGVEVRFGFTSGLGLSLNIGLSLVLGLKDIEYDKKS